MGSGVGIENDVSTGLSKADGFMIVPAIGKLLTVPSANNIKNWLEKVATLAMDAEVEKLKGLDGCR